MPFDIMYLVIPISVGIVLLCVLAVIYLLNRFQKSRASDEQRLAEVVKEEDGAAQPTANNEQELAEMGTV